MKVLPFFVVGLMGFLIGFSMLDPVGSSVASTVEPLDHVVVSSSNCAEAVSQYNECHSRHSALVDKYNNLVDKNNNCYYHLDHLLTEWKNNPGTDYQINGYTVSVDDIQFVIIGTGDSMLPSISSGNTVLCAERPFNSVTVGQIIYVSVGSENFAHRVIGKHSDGRFITRGDHNPFTDQEQRSVAIESGDGDFVLEPIYVGPDEYMCTVVGVLFT